MRSLAPAHAVVLRWVFVWFLAASLCHCALAAGPPVVSFAFNHGRWIFSWQQKAGQKRPGFYRQEGLTGQARLLLDPNSPATPALYLPEDFNLSSDGQYVCFEVAQADAPFEEIHVMELATCRILADVVKWTAFTDIAWRGRGFYYAKYPGPLTNAAAKPSNQGVYYHRLGTPQSADVLVYADVTHPSYFYTFLNTFDERFFFLHITDPVAGHDTESFLVRNDGRNETRFTSLGKPFSPGRYYLCDEVRDKFVIFTTAGAPRGRVILIDPSHPDAKQWETLVPESRETLDSADMAAGKLFLTYALSNGLARVVVCGLDGRPENQMPLPSPGKVDVQWGRQEDSLVFFSVAPRLGSKTWYIYDVRTKQAGAFVPAGG